MSELAQLVVFVLGRQRFAVALAHVQRVVAAAETTPVPGAPAIVLGVFDLAGEVIAVLDPRRRLSAEAGQAEAAQVSVDDQFVIARAGERTIALLVNQTLGVVEREVSTLSTPAWAAPDIGRYEGAATLDDGLVLIHDIEKFLSPQEARALDRALEEHR